MENIWETYGKHMEIMENMEKSWETYGKQMENIWNTYGKHMGSPKEWSFEWENQRSVHCGDVGFFMEHRG